MRVLLTSAGLETEEIQECFVDMVGKDMGSAKALFIPTAAINAGAIICLTNTCALVIRAFPEGLEIIGE